MLLMLAAAEARRGGLLQELEELALRDGDPRVRRPAAAALALACCALRRGPAAGTLSSGAESEEMMEGAGSTALVAGLRLLPESGAMRPLLERLLDVSRLPQLGPDLESAILRTLATAERLPALPWGAHVQHVLRRYPSGASDGPQGNACPLDSSSMAETKESV